MTHLCMAFDAPMLHTIQYTHFLTSLRLSNSFKEEYVSEKWISTVLKRTHSQEAPTSQLKSKDGPNAVAAIPDKSKDGPNAVAVIPTQHRLTHQILDHCLSFQDLKYFRSLVVLNNYVFVSNRASSSHPRTLSFGQRWSTQSLKRSMSPDVYFGSNR